MKRRNKKAFTIIELIVVIAILGILVLLGMNNFTGNVKNAKHTKVMVATKTIEDASGMYHMDNNDWPRLTDEPYTKEQLEAFAIKFYDNTGKEITLDPEGNYYDIDYDKLSQYAKAPENKKDYILQNPVGKIFYMENLNEAGENRVDYVAKKQTNTSIPSVPVLSDITENSVIVTGQDGTEVKLNDGQWFNSPHTFIGLNEDIEYTVYIRFKETESKLPSAVSEGVKFTTQSGDLYEFTTHTFTSAGQTGNTGPNQSQLNNAYKGSQVEGQVTSNNGIQEWIVPKSGTYRIETYGAQGGNGTTNGRQPGSGGKGAIIKSYFELELNSVLKVLVGQQGSSISYGGSNAGGGGGGGSFVSRIDNTPLIIAGGGAGTGANVYIINETNSNGQPTQNPGISSSSSHKASNGSGGAGGYDGAGGGGFYNDGSNSIDNAFGKGGKSFVNGGRGGIFSSGPHLGYGGFGGGGGVGHAGGGGGGYNGGNGTGQWGNGSWAGGGGSFNSGTNQSNTVGNVGHGKVIITYIGK